MRKNAMSHIAEFLDTFEKDRPYLDEITDFDYYL